jgi:hypothetical protein
MIQASDIAIEEDPVHDSDGLEPAGTGPRRFVISAVVGMCVVSVPYLFTLWDLWSGNLNAFRLVAPSNYYDLQAQAMVRGHLYLPTGKLGIEAFTRNGHAFTYFGVFPSLLRMPVLALFPSLIGRLTAPSILLAWIITGVFASMLFWRVRILARGNKVIGWAEAASGGFLVAAITGGSVLLYLAANPWVYDEDFAWSVALTLGTLFALLGVMERPTWWRTIFTGLIILAASLNRLATGWACIIGAILVAGWLFFGRGGVEKRRWAFPVLGAGLIPMLIASLINYSKFGSPFALPLADQAWTQINAHRRYFLRVNGGKGFGLQFLPSTLFAYFQPAGIHFSNLFPYVTIPTAPARTVGSAVLDETYPTGSIPATMPLLFLLGIWGLITAFRPRSIGSIRYTRVLLLTGAAATGGVLLWGYIADRYLADFMPLLVLASAIGLVDIFRRFDERKRTFRISLVAVVAILAVFGIVANAGAAMESLNDWTTKQALEFVKVQRAASIGSLNSAVVRSRTLPYWAPAGAIYDVNNCSGLYLSSGDNFSNSPGQQIQHAGWVPLEQGVGINTTIAIRLRTRPRDFKGPLPIFKYGATTVLLESSGMREFKLVLQHPGRSPSWPSAESFPIVLKPHRTSLFSVMTDPNLHSIQISALNLVGGSLLLDHFLSGTGPAVVVPTPADRSNSQITVTERRSSTSSTMQLCKSLRKANE